MKILLAVAALLAGTEALRHHGQHWAAKTHHNDADQCMKDNCADQRGACDDACWGVLKKCFPEAPAGWDQCMNDNPNS